MPTMAATAMEATDTARGPLMPMPTTAMEVMEAMAATAMARGPLMLTTVATDMEAMAATATARGPLMLTTVATDTAAMADTATASNFRNNNDLKPQKISIPDLNLFANCCHDLNHLEIQY